MAESLPPLTSAFQPQLKSWPISRYLVLGFIYPNKVLMNWADDHKVGLGKNVLQRRQETW